MALALIVLNALALLAFTVAIVAGLASAHPVIPVEVYPRTHVTVALSASILVLFAHCMTMFYFIGTGIRMKELVAEHGVTEDLVTPTKRIKGKVFPFATMALLATMVTFIIGGGVDTGQLPSWVHLLLALIAFALNYLAVSFEIRAINYNVRLFDRLEAIVVAEQAPGEGAQAEA